jgi:hypothetical protein
MYNKEIILIWLKISEEEVFQAKVYYKKITENQDFHGFMLSWRGSP